MCRKIRVLTELILCLIVALADAACVSRSSPTIFAHACHKTLTSWVCRLLRGGYSLYSSWIPPPLRKNRPRAETRMLNPGSRSGAILLHRKTYASRSCSQHLQVFRCGAKVWGRVEHNALWKSVEGNAFGYNRQDRLSETQPVYEFLSSFGIDLF